MKKFITEIMHQPEVFSVREMLVKGWGSMKQHWGKFLLLSVLYLATMMAWLMIASAAGMSSWVLAVLVSLLFIGLLLLLHVAFARLILWAAKGKDFSFSSLLTLDFKAIGSILVCSVIYTTLVIVGFCLFAIPGIYFAFIYSLSGFLIVDKGMGPLKAMKESKALMRRHLFNVFAYAATAYGLAYVIIAPVYFVFYIAMTVAVAVGDPLLYYPVITGIGIAVMALVSLLLLAVLIAYNLAVAFGFGHIYRKLLGS